MKTHLTHLQSTLAPLQQHLYSHPLYHQLQALDHLKHFMSFHVFAVWDFMNLVCALQSHFTTTSIPWKPPAHPALARLINEIKLEEESDVIDGEVTSHFAYYLKSMSNLDISTETISTFMETLKESGYSPAIQSPSLPTCVQDFLRHTQACIDKGPVAVAASFTFGRETLIPPMFIRILENTAPSPQLDTFKQYLERHIELDGDTHGPLSLDLISELCGTDEALWLEAETFAKSAIEARLDFYTAILRAKAPEQK